MNTRPLLATILRYMVYAAAFMPLVIFSQYVSPFHFGKVVLFRSAVEAMLALYIPLALLYPEYRPRLNKIFWTFLGFTVAYTIATLTSVNPFQSFWGTLERMGGAYSFWHYFFFYIIAVSVLRTASDWLTFLKITVLSGALSALYGFGQRTNLSFIIGSGGRERIFGTIGNAALFAGYEILNIFLAIVLGINAVKSGERKFFFISAALMVLAVFLSAVRGSILGLSVGLVVFGGLYFYQTKSKLARKATFGLLALIVLFIVFAFAFKNTSFVKNSGYFRRVTDLSFSSFTVQTRFWAWQAGLKGWRETPQKVLTGWGPENFNIPFSKYFNPKFFGGPGSETLFDRAHNMFVEILVTTGLVGLIAYLLMFAGVFQTLWRLKNKPEYRVAGIGFIAMTVAYIIHNAFIFDTSANLLVFFSVLAYISYLESVAIPREVKVGRAFPAGIAKALGTVLVVAAIFVIYQTNVKTSIANYATTRGIVAGWNNDFNGAVAAYQKAVSYNVAGRYEYRNRYAQFLLDYGSANDVSVAGVQAAFKEAIALEEKNAKENPLDYLPELYLSRLNIILGKSDAKSPYNDEALKHSGKALSYSETFVRTYYEIGQAYLNKGDYAGAEAQFQKAIELNPDVGISYWYLGAVQMQESKVDAALKNIDLAIEKGYALSEGDYLNLAGTYVKRNDYPRLVTVYEGLLNLKPDNPQYAASLAVAYARVGRIDDAVKTAHLAAKLDPSFEGDAKAFVQQLGRQW